MFRKFLLILTLIGTVVATEAISAATWLNGRVVGVSDGDTLTLLAAGNHRIKVRLAGIDAPEKRQPYGRKSKQALSDMVYGRDVSVRVEQTDRYGRSVGSVRYGGRDINRVMVEHGHAWAYKRYLPAHSPWPALEQRARDRGIGLWALPDEQRIPPWSWRRQKTKKTARPVIGDSRQAGTPLPTGCGNKQFCRQMLSCTEAKHYLRLCGLARLDGDGDGTPCESLCRP